MSDDYRYRPFEADDLLNDSAEEALDTDKLFNSTFGSPTVFVWPRPAMLGRLNGGR